MDEMDIVIQFAKLWGIEIADSRCNENKYRKMESYDSSDLLDLLLSWKNDYIHDENADDTVDFFNNKLNSLLNNNI